VVYKVATLLFLFASVPLEAHGADVFRWVDENGKVHYGDTIPDKYKQKAKKVEAAGAGVTDAQRMEAESRIAKERARAESLQRTREAQAEGAQTISSPPSDVPKAKDECQEQLQKYLDSQTCFAPYFLRGGGVKPEAFQNCTEVKQPRGCWQSPTSADRDYKP
jgi:Domain of unknown function (DUF4124)